MPQLGPYSPTTLATSPLPPKLRAAQLAIDDFLTSNDDDFYDLCVASGQLMFNHYA